jgi:phosphorylcholine metabolism protein LicD
MIKYQIPILLVFVVSFSSYTQYLTVTGAVLNSGNNTLLLYQMMKDIDELFTKEQIEYWAIGGTLLGAVRHCGIIPWDHEPDLDIGIHRNQFDALLKLQPKLDKLGYILLPTSCNSFWQLFNKNTPRNFPYMDIFIFNNKDNYDVFAYTIYYGRAYLLRSEIYPIQRMKFGSYFINCPFNPHPYLNSYYKDWQTTGLLYLGKDKGSSSFVLKQQDYLPALPIEPLENRVDSLCYE